MWCPLAPAPASWFVDSPHTTKHKINKRTTTRHARRLPGAGAPAKSERKTEERSEAGPGRLARVAGAGVCGDLRFLASYGPLYTVQTERTKLTFSGTLVTALLRLISSSWHGSCDRQGARTTPYAPHATAPGTSHDRAPSQGGLTRDSVRHQYLNQDEAILSIHEKATYAPPPLRREPPPVAAGSPSAE